MLAIPDAWTMPKPQYTLNKLLMLRSRSVITSYYAAYRHQPWAVALGAIYPLNKSCPSLPVPTSHLQMDGFTYIRFTHTISLTTAYRLTCLC